MHIHLLWKGITQYDTLRSTNSKQQTGEQLKMKVREKTPHNCENEVKYIEAVDHNL